MNYLIYGNSYNLIKDEIEKINKNKEIKTVYLSETDLIEVIEDASYTSLFNEEKTVIIKEAELLSKSKDIESVINYLKDPNPNVTLIFISNTKLDSKNKVIKDFLSNIKILETKIYLKDYEMAKDLKIYIEKVGIRASNDTLAQIASKCALNYDIFVNEFNKLIPKLKGGIIKNSDVDLIPNYNLASSFELKDAIVLKQVNRAMTLLDEFETSKAEMIGLVVMLIREYRLIYDIKYLKNKKTSDDEISKLLGKIHPYRIKILYDNSRRYSDTELKKIIKDLSNLYIKITSNDNLGFDELRIFVAKYL